MKHLSFLTICIMACFVMSCSSDSDPAPDNTKESKYTQEDFMALYHGTPQVLANIVTNGTVEMNKWNQLLSLFVEEEPDVTRGPIGQVVSLAQFAGKCSVVCKDANMDIYMRLKSMGITYKEMFNNVEPEHRSGYANAEEWEIAMNQGKITNPYCFSDLATAYALNLEADKGYNQYRYKILANTSVELAEEGINVIASFDSDVSNAKNAYDFVNASMTGDWETISSKISGLIDETGGDISDASLYAFKAYLEYCLDNRETSFSWTPKNGTFFSGYWYEKIDDATEYEYEIYEDNDIVDETMYRSKLEKDNDKPIGNAQKMSCTLYCGKEYIFYIKENGKITPYRIINTAGDYVTSEDAFFYMIEVGGTTKKLWRRTPYYSHEKQEEEPTIPETNQDKLVGTWYNENLDGTTLYKSHVTFNADSTWSCVQYANMEELTNSVSDGLYATSEGKWELLKHFDNDGTDQGFYYLYVGNVSKAYFERAGTSLYFKGYKTWIARNDKAYEKLAMTIEFDESGTTMKITNHRINQWFVNRDKADETQSVILPFNYEVTYTKQK